MAKSARGSTKDSFTDYMITVATSAEVFPDGSAVELVSSADDEGLALLHWSDDRAAIAKEIRRNGILYKPVELHPSFRRAIRIPSGIADAVVPGPLFRELSELAWEYIGVSETEALKIAVWNVTTWFPDLLQNPPALVVSGQELPQAMKLFRLNQCLCRRGIILADIDRRALASLPMELRPTVMIAKPELSDRFWSLWSAATYRGSFIPGPRGTVLDVVCSKALFTGTNGVSRWSDNAIHVVLPPTRSDLAPLDDRQQKQIADRYLPQLLRYRLEHLQMMRQTSSPGKKSDFPTGDLATNLSLCMPDEPGITQNLDILLREQEDDRLQRLSLDPASAMIEVLWGKLPDPRGCITMAKLADTVNALLLSRGANRVYSPEEIGWKRRQLGIARGKGSDANLVRFSPETSKRIHELVRLFGLDLPPHPVSCMFCTKPKAIDI